MATESVLLFILIFFFGLKYMILLLEFLFETLGNRLVFLFFLTNGIKFQKPICNSLLICRLRDMERRDERSGHHSHSYMYLMKTSSLKYTSVVNVDEEMRKFPGTIPLGLYPHAGRVGGHSFMSVFLSSPYTI